LKYENSIFLNFVFDQIRLITLLISTILQPNDVMEINYGLKLYL